MRRKVHRLKYSRRLLTLCVGIVFVIVNVAAGQGGLDLRASLTGGTWKPLKIAIADFKVAGQLSLEVDSLARAIRMSRCCTRSAN